MVGLLAVLEMYRHLWLALAGVVTSLSYCRAAELVTRPHSHRHCSDKHEEKKKLAGSYTSGDLGNVKS